MRHRLLLTAASVATVAAALSAVPSAASGAAAADPARPAAKALDNPYDPARATLLGRAVLPALTFAPGPPTGAFSDPNNGFVPPYPQQVVLGISSALQGKDGSYWAMPDNGFGTKGNSPDFLLRLYRFTPDYETAKGGSGTIDVGTFISLRDPDRRIPFPIVNGDTKDRLLTGGDFDVESVVRAPDGSMWIGDEFGPFLLHFSADGRLIEAPVAHPTLISPSSPLLAPGQQPTVRGSRGYEALSMSEDGKFLYPVVEGPLVQETNLRRRVVLEFDVRKRQYTDKTWQYKVDGDDFRIADMQRLDDDRFVLIEREDLEGPAAFYKKVFLIDLSKVDADGFLVKSEVADLMNLRNPALIGANTPAGGFGLGNPFTFPLQSVESLLLLPGKRILVTQDNNFPDSTGRVAGQTDGTESIVIGFPKD